MQLLSYLHPRWSFCSADVVDPAVVDIPAVVGVPTLTCVSAARPDNFSVIAVAIACLCGCTFGFLVSGKHAAIVMASLKHVTGVPAEADDPAFAGVPAIARFPALAASNPPAICSLLLLAFLQLEFPAVYCSSTLWVKPTILPTCTKAYRTAMMPSHAYLS